MNHSWSSRFPGRVRISGDWWNPVDDVEAVADTVQDAWSTLKDNVPGFQQFSDAFDAVITNPMRDFLNSPVGKIVGPIVMTAFASSAYMLAAPQVGAQLASATFALPGIARGDKNFVKAWTEEFVSRVTALIAYFVAKGVPADVSTSQVGQMFQDGFDACQKAFDSLGANLGIDFRTLAAKAGVRQEVAARWLAQQMNDMHFVDDYDWDPETGVGTKIPSAQDKLKTLAQQQMDAFLKAQAARRASVASAVTKLEQGKATVDLATRFIAPPPAVHPSAPELGPLTGASPPVPVASVMQTTPSGLTTPQKIGLGAAALAVLGAAAKLLPLL